MHNTGEWRDLNLKFVLTTYRDYVHVATDGDAFLQRSWPCLQVCISQKDKQECGNYQLTLIFSILRGKNMFQGKKFQKKFLLKKMYKKSFDLFFLFA